jgi:membrane associated rhomboid family serine protease
VARFGEPLNSPLTLPRPGKVLRVTLIGLLAIWVLFAVLVNWGDTGSGIFLALAANTDAVLHGQLWRLFTASLIHVPTGTIGHIASALFGLYFLAPSLESSWGSARFARFLLLTGFISYGVQALVGGVLSSAWSERLVPSYSYGAMPVVEAIAIAWACSFRDRTVQLFFVLPVTSTALIVFVVGVSIMSLIAGATPPSGHVALFAGMGAGYLLGGGTPSPLRRVYLRYRLARLEADAKNERKKRTGSGGLRLIQGGKKPKNTELH